MKKKDLRKRVEALEARVAELETRVPTWVPWQYPQPYTITYTSTADAAN